MLNYVQLETLKAVDENGTLEGAARALRVSSFAVGRRISKLEKTLGVRLLEKAPTSVTDVGKILCGHLNKVVSLENETLDDTREDHQGDLDNRPRFKIALPEEIATGAFVEIIRQLKDSNHPSRFDITICNPDKSTTLMQSGEVSAAISIRKTPIHGFKIYSLKEMTYKAVASPRFVHRHFPDGITEASLLAAPSSMDSLNTKWAEDILGKTCTLSHYNPSPDDVTALPLLENEAWSLLLADQAEPYLEDGSLIELQNDAVLTRQLYWHISTAMLDQMKIITDKIRQKFG